MAIDKAAAIRRSAQQVGGRANMPLDQALKRIHDSGVLNSVPSKWGSKMTITPDGLVNLGNETSRRFDAIQSAGLIGLAMLAGAGFASAGGAAAGPNTAGAAAGSTAGAAPAAAAAPTATAAPAAATAAAPAGAVAAKSTFLGMTAGEAGQLILLGSALAGNKKQPEIGKPEEPPTPNSERETEANLTGMTAQQKRRLQNAGRSGTIKTGPRGLGEVDSGNLRMKQLIGY